MNQAEKDIKFMAAAIQEAKSALKSKDIPVGAVLVYNDKIIARSKNEVELQNDSTAHAELLSIKQAVNTLNYKHLHDCTLYITLEPCPMCAGAIVLARIPRIVYGTDDPKTGAVSSLFSITNDSRLNHRCEIVDGVLKDECSELLKNFFKNLRESKKND